MTIGTDRVRTTFNPSANSLVDQIKCKTAELIDLCAEAKATSMPPLPGAPKDSSAAASQAFSREIAEANARHEAGRLWALAMTAYEEAAMWAVKAST
jgi:hypothetical protein